MATQFVGAWRRWLAWPAALLIVLLLATAALWWWAGTEGSLAWTLRQVARFEPLTAEGVRGSLRSGLQLQRLQWERDGLKVEAFDVKLAWEPLALARGTLRLNQVAAARVRVEDRRPPKPSQAPRSLMLPLRLAIGEARIGQLQWVAAAQALDASDIAGGYRFDGTEHQVQLDRLDWSGGRYRAQAALGAMGDLPLAATLEGHLTTTVPGSDRPVPLGLTASLRGPLTDMQVSALLQTQAVSPTVAPRATATARLTPWAPQPIPQAEAVFQQLDLSVLWPQAPRTSLAGQARVTPSGTGTWAVSTDLRNEMPGPWDAQRLPIEQLSAEGEWRPSGPALVRSLHARLGGGRVQASGSWEGTDGWAVRGRLDGINPAALHSEMAARPLSGRADVTGRGQAVSLDLDLRGADALLRADVQLRLDARAGSGDVTLEAPGLKARAQGRLAENAGAGNLQVSSSDMAQALAWVTRFPGTPTALRNPLAAGRGVAQVDWQGGWRDPVVKAALAAPLIQLRPDTLSSTASTAKGDIPAGAAKSNVPPAWLVRDVIATVEGRLSDAAVQVRGRAELGARQVALELSGRGGRRGRTPAVWQGQLAALNVSASDPAMGTGTWALALRRPFDVRWSERRFMAGAGEAVLSAPQRAQPQVAGHDAQAAVLAWEPVRWQAGELQTAGRLSGLPLGWIELVGGPPLAAAALSGDMVFDAQWDASFGATPRLRASLERTRGDLTVLVETAEGTSARVRAGVREARLLLTTQAEALRLQLRWDSERGGHAEGQLDTRLTRGGAAGWHWAGNAPLAGHLRAQLPRIGVWSLLAPPGWRLRGSLATDLAIAGSRDLPRLSGSMAADDLALRSVVDGIELQGGRLRAHLEGQRLLIDEFLLQGAGAAGAGGTLVATGEGAWSAGGPQVRMSAELNRLRASIRSDRAITVSGKISARHDADGTAVNGNLLVDQALIVLPEEGTPRLGDDVVVRGAAGPLTRKQARVAEQAARPPAQRLALAVDIDLGNDFRVRGQGIDTRLRGTVALGGQSISAPQLVGTIRARGGEYRAYGQRLDIERGELRFTGPIDNPALDLLAIRPNLVQRVGVQVTGRALAPYVRLYAEPDMPDAEKLSWLVTGRASPSGGAEAALLQQAGLALLAGRSRGDRRGVAEALGLDELSFRRDGTEGPSVTLGKRFGRDFYAAYERSLSGALGTLYIFYDLTRRITVRAEAGERRAIDLITTWSFD